MKEFFRINAHYFWYIVRHKWFVFVECWKYGIIWRGIWHDWHKLLPGEWIPYANWFNHSYGIRYSWSDDVPRPSHVPAEYFYNLPKHHRLEYKFDIAWLSHQKKAKHHWQWWILRNDDGSERAIEMPLVYAKEMLADWHGAGRAIVGKSSDTKQWYLDNAKDTITLHPNTREFVEIELGIKTQ